MRIAEGLTIFAQFINILIFIYFSVVLMKINALDVIGLAISAFGIFISLIANILSAIK